MKNINIKAVTQLTGINENTLRAWERRYSALAPQKDDAGRRIYNKKDIDKLQLLGILVQKGHLIGNLAEKSLNELKSISENLVPSNDIDIKQSEQFSDTAESHLVKIIESLKKFDLNQVHSSLQGARFELSPREIINSLILPLMREVGSLVAESKLRISQEHLLSSMLRDHLGQLYQSLGPHEYKKKQQSKKIIITTREGDLHEFGILLAAILCRINGHETYYLGPNMPVDDLANAAIDFKVDAMVLGLSQLPKERELISVSQFLKQLDHQTPKKIDLFCGGSSDFADQIIKSNRQFVRFSTLAELDQFLRIN